MTRTSTSFEGREQEIVDAFNRHFSPNVTLDVEYDIDAVFTISESMDQFKAARKGWSDKGQIIESGDDYMYITGAQAASGQRRKDVCIVVIDGVTFVYEA